MLSMALLHTAADAAKYYEKDDYYAAESSAEPDAADGSGAGASSAPRLSAAGQWFGEGAERLGLSGAVERTTFQAVLEGRLPNGVVLGRGTDATRAHTPGWDLTFSAPKSVSILAEVSGDERLMRAHETAVGEALHWAEREALGTVQRTEAGRQFERTGAMVAAVFMHHTSRNQDPNLHSHAVVANATQRDNGAWVSVQSRELFRHKMLLGQIYRSALAREATRLGYDVVRTDRDGRFELAAVDAADLRQWSSRRAEIERKLAQWDRNSPQAAARAALVTRSHKRAQTRSDLLNRWRGQGSERVAALDAAAGAARERGPVAPARVPTLENALQETVLSLAEAEAVFSHADLVRRMLALTLGRYGVEDVERAIRAAAASNRLQRADDEHMKQWTTPVALSRERFALRTMLEGQTRRAGILEPSEATRALANTDLNTGQRSAAQLALTSRDQYVGIVGRPGTGKTTLLKTVRELAEAQGYAVHGMAPNAAAARELQDKAGITATTMHRHLQRVGRAVTEHQKAGMIGKQWVRWQQGRQLWIVDEASQMSNSLARRVMYAADRLGARVVFLGDTRQLPAIEAGKPFELLLQRGMASTEMREILRQRDAGDRQMVESAVRGQMAEALKALGDRMVEVPDRSERLAAMLERWRAMGGADADTLLFTPRNADKIQLNEGVRDWLREDGRLSAEQSREVLDRVWGRAAERRDAASFEAGQVVYFPRRVESLGIARGEYLDVRAVDVRTNQVTLARSDGTDSRTVQWNPREDVTSSKDTVQVYRRRGTTLAPGERVRWSQNQPDRGLVNGEILTVHSVSAKATVFQRGDGQQIPIDHGDRRGQHWDHAYATTVFSAQGRTASQAILNADSDAGSLFSQKAAVVGLSRHRDGIVVFTDSRRDLLENLERTPGDKTSAVESRERWERAASDSVRAARRPAPEVDRGHARD